MGTPNKMQPKIHLLLLFWSCLPITFVCGFLYPNWSLIYECTFLALPDPFLFILAWQLSKNHSPGTESLKKYCIAIFREKATSPLADFLTGPLGWSNWNLELLVFVEGGKPEYLIKKTLGGSREPASEPSGWFHSKLWQCYDEIYLQ